MATLIVQVSAEDPDKFTPELIGKTLDAVTAGIADFGGGQVEIFLKEDEPDQSFRLQRTSGVANHDVSSPGGVPELGADRH